MAYWSVDVQNATIIVASVKEILIYFQAFLIIALIIEILRLFTGGGASAHTPPVLNKLFGGGAPAAEMAAERMAKKELGGEKKLVYEEAKEKGIVKGLEKLEQQGIENVERIINDIKKIINLLKNKKLQTDPNAINEVAAKLDEIAPLAVGLHAIETRIAGLIRDLEAWEAKDFKMILEEMDSLKYELSATQYYGKIINQDQANKVARYITAKMMELKKIKEDEFDLVKTKLEQGVSAIINFEAEFEARYRQGVELLRTRNFNTAITSFEECVSYLRKIENMLRYEEKIEKVIEKLEKHELRNIKTEEQLEMLLIKVLGKQKRAGVVAGAGATLTKPRF